MAAALLAAAAWADDAPPLPPGLAPAKPEATAPALPEGLGKKDAAPALPPGLAPTTPTETTPALPTGLEPSKPDGPALPEGLDAPASADATATEPEPRRFTLPTGLTGFAETRAGVRVQDDPVEKSAALGETRLHLEYEKAVDALLLKVSGDFLADPLQKEHGIDLESGDGWLDLREAFVSFSPFDFMDVKAGRQILTWGTGDLLFINDAFPKDWNAFFIGRDENYLKAPSDALKTSFFTDVGNLDVVFTPRFDADRFVDGTRLSFWNDQVGARTGRGLPVSTERPDRWLEDNELALRMYRVIEGYECALYGYRGYWKSPGGFNPASGRATFPRLGVYGASARGPVGPGIGNVEAGFYDSREDRSGRDPFTNNSELRLLAGYEQEVATDLTASLQYYVEHMMDYGDYRRTLPAGARTRDEDRHTVTLRLTKRLMNQNLTLSVFTRYSPSDNDWYVRPKVSYKISDHWAVETGSNLFWGQEKYTFLGQFSRNSNVYAGIRYSF